MKNYKYKELLEISNRLNYIQDITTVLDAILFHSRRLTNADAGTIYLKKNDELVFSFTQNETLMTSNLDNYHIYQNLKVPIDENSIAGYVCYNKSLLNISNVYKLSNTLSYHFNDKFDKKFSYQTKSMLTSPILDLNKDSIGVIQLINAKNKKDKIVGFNKADEELIENFSNIISVHIERTHLKNEMILRMIKMAELRDPKETGPHVERVGAMSAELYEQWALKNGIDKKEIKKDKGYLHLSAKLHDVGKIAISDLLLKKPERFNDSEFNSMKYHTVYGAQLFYNSKSELDKMSTEISLRHHERWDGKGYPGKIGNIHRKTENIKFSKGLKGEEIPIFARIVRIADVYDALMSKRVYKNAWKEKDCLDYLEKNKGTEFDPDLVDYFFDIYGTIKSIQNKYQEH